MRLTRILTAAALVLGGLVATAAPAAAAEDCFTGGVDLTTVPWEQKMLPPDKVAPFATGKGVIVALLDTGVEASHPALKGRVLPGRDFLKSGAADTDCVGHGTGVAGVIVGKSPDGKFKGVAPGAQILPVRVVDRDPQAPEDKTGDKAVKPEEFAAAINWAVDQHADVINMSLKYDTPYPVIENAIKRAHDAGVVLVASGGNDHKDDEYKIKGKDTISYPVGYAGVLGVGAIGPTGKRAPISEIGEWIDLVAPGESVTYATRDGKYAATTGTSLSAPYVAATAALIIESHPELKGKPDEIAKRILGTASPAPGDAGYGAGIVDPYRAVTDQMTGDAPAAMEPMTVAPVDPAQAAAERAYRHNQDMATWIALGTLTGVVLIVTAVGALRRGRRRKWRVARAAPIDDGPDDGDGAPIQLLRDLKI
ncbi:hypothetical protein Afil01_66320 [Actinorhabdospora filicis]|uniref:Peptidase S8/S53 domain-containing protein n=1 Tax=Actinorhabdospora filicis TaxID=1785913 RepID=A0A9W6STT8_9ACTN|nr:S8 family serine peptidase [Actinorhabdospora filicis]GLZ81825.1 hypothetical protein Afil01_66320 [Actinorhabdospora filicis]